MDTKIWGQIVFIYAQLDYEDRIEYLNKYNNFGDSNQFNNDKFPYTIELLILKLTIEKNGVDTTLSELAAIKKLKNK